MSKPETVSKPFYSTKEAAAILGCSIRMLLERAQHGQIPVVRMGWRYRFDRKFIDQAVRKGLPRWTADREVLRSKAKAEKATGKRGAL